VLNGNAGPRTEIVLCSQSLTLHPHNPALSTSRIIRVILVRVYSTSRRYISSGHVISALLAWGQSSEHICVCTDGSWPVSTVL
jgi:hypothetical protein